MSNSIILQENSIFGDFKLVKLLGRGGMAEVYFAQSEGVGGFQRNLALKVIHPQLSHDQDFVQMLIDEAKLSAQLNHPNIVHIHNLGQVKGVYYIAMELIDGCDVYQALVKSEERSEHFPTDVAAWIAHEACAGLYYAHTRQDSTGAPLNIIHRDISPQNLQLSREGEVKIVDFGIAKAEQRTSYTQQGVIKGKYSYMSPEQAWGDEIDHRSDIFSLGICLYEMIAGEILYDAEDGLGLLEQVRLAQIPNLRAIRPDVAPELEQIVYRSLAAEPQQRFQSAEEMRIELASYLFRAGVTSGRQRLTQFLGALLVEEQPRGVAITDALEDEDGATRAVSAAMFESLHSSHMQIATPSEGLSIDDQGEQEATRALSADAFALLHSGGSPQTSSLDTQEATRALSVDAFAQLQPSHSNNPGAADATRALSAEAFSQLQTPQPNQFDQQDATRAVSANSFPQDYAALPRPPQVNKQQVAPIQTPSETLPIAMGAPIISPAAPPPPSPPQFGQQSFQAEAHTRALDTNVALSLRSTLNAPEPKVSPPSPALNSPFISAGSSPVQSSMVPPPFNQYESEESTRAVDLQQLKAEQSGQAGSPAPSLYQKQVLRETFSIPQLSETPIPEIPQNTSLGDPYQSSPDPRPAPSPDPSPSPSPSPSPDPTPSLSLNPSPSPDPSPSPSPDPSPSPSPEVSLDPSAPVTEELSALKEGDSSNQRKKSRRSRKAEEREMNEQVAPPKPKRRAKGKGQRKSVARYVIIVAAVLVIGVGAVTLASKLLKPPVPSTFTLRVTSPNAKGARVYLDGGDTGQRTPALLQNLLKPDIEYLIKLKAAGYEAQERKVLITSQQLAERPEQEQLLRVSLPRAKGTLRVTSTPSGATVMMGDQYLGKTPITRSGLTRSEESVRVIFQHPKCKRMSRVFSWRDEVESSIDVQLRCSR